MSKQTGTRYVALLRGTVDGINPHYSEIAHGATLAEAFENGKRAIFAHPLYSGQQKLMQFNAMVVRAS